MLLGSSTPQDRDTLALARTAVLPSVWADNVGIPYSLFRSSIPSLHIPLSNASSASLPPHSHGSGPEWLAITSLYDSFIRYSMPVYPGAIQPKRADPTGCLPEFDRSLPGELLSSAPSWQAIS